MRVRIVSYEDVNAWILGKFARKLNEELLKLGVQSDISNVPDPHADINHHIIYTYCKPGQPAHNDTVMITHVDEIHKANLLKKQLATAKAGICMSAATMNELIGIGLPADKLCYVSPAHDNVMKPRRISIGITSKVQPTGSKREDLIIRLAESLDHMLFEFVIMGSGWESVIDKLKKKGAHVTYYNQFDYDRYIQILPAFDYYLYPGQDEGSMGFIDALASGVKTVVTPQGFHLDAPGGISHPFNTAEELLAIFEKISAERRNLINAVSTWTWADYAIKHLEIWKYITDQLEIHSSYSDGVNSLLHKQPATRVDVQTYKKSLYQGTSRRIVYVTLGRIKKLGNPAWVMRKMKSIISRSNNSGPASK
jgi:hypothetical protein